MSLVSNRKSSSTGSRNDTISSSTTSSTSTTDHASPRKPTPQELISSATAAAQYRRNLKYGIYHQPGAPIVGVPKQSSDTAAILATQSDLSLKLWHHEGYPAAGTAAVLASSTNTSPEIWKPDLSSEAAQAALIAREKDDYDGTPEQKAFQKRRQSQLSANASKAALSAHETPGHEFGQKALPDAYEWGERRSRTGSTSTAFDAAGASVLNAQSLSASAAGAALSHPELGASTFANIANIEETARNQAREKLAKLYLPSHGGASLAMASAGSGAALSHSSDYSDPLLKLTPQHLDAAQSENLMAHAKERAEARLRVVDKYNAERNLFGNADYNATALAIATANSKKRLENHGKIDLGGGKFISQSDVEQIAQRNVRPVLAEITEKVDAQRKADEEKLAAEQAFREKREHEKQLDRERKAEVKRLKDEDSAKKKAEKAKLKAEEQERKAELAKQRAKEDAFRKEEQIKVRQAHDAEQARIKAETLQLRAAQDAENARVRAIEKERKAAEKATRKARKNELKNAVDEAKHAQLLATVEVTKTKALVDRAAAEVEAAKLAESQAAPGDAAEEARKVTEQKEAALVRAQTDLAEATDQREAKTHAELQAQAAINEADVAEAAAVEEEEAAEPAVEGEEPVVDEAEPAVAEPAVEEEKVEGEGELQDSEITEKAIEEGTELPSEELEPITEEPIEEDAKEVEESAEVESSEVQEPEVEEPTEEPTEVQEPEVEEPADVEPVATEVEPSEVEEREVEEPTELHAAAAGVEPSEVQEPEVEEPTESIAYSESFTDAVETSSRVHVTDTEKADEAAKEEAEAAATTTGTATAVPIIVATPAEEKVVASEESAGESLAKETPATSTEEANPPVSAIATTSLTSTSPSNSPPVSPSKRKIGTWVKTKLRRLSNAGSSKSPTSDTPPQSAGTEPESPQHTLKEKLDSKKISIPSFKSAKTPVQPLQTSSDTTGGSFASSAAKAALSGTTPAAAEEPQVVVGPSSATGSVPVSATATPPVSKKPAAIEDQKEAIEKEFSQFDSTSPHVADKPANESVGIVQGVVENILHLENGDAPESKPKPEASRENEGIFKEEVS